MGKSQSSGKKTLVIQVFMSNIEKCLAWNIPIADNIVLNETIVDSKTFYAQTVYDKNRDLYTVTVSDLIWQEYPHGTKFALTQILFHELIHTCPQCFNHSKEWKKWVILLNEKHGCKINPHPYTTKLTPLY